MPKAGGKFDAEEYDAHPEKYRSVFVEKVCPTRAIQFSVEFSSHDK